MANLLSHVVDPRARPARAPPTVGNLCRAEGRETRQASGQLETYSQAYLMCYASEASLGHVCPLLNAHKFAVGKFGSHVLRT